MDGDSGFPLSNQDGGKKRERERDWELSFHSFSTWAGPTLSWAELSLLVTTFLKKAQERKEDPPPSPSWMIISSSFGGSFLFFFLGIRSASLPLSFFPKRKSRSKRPPTVFPGRKKERDTRSPRRKKSSVARRKIKCKVENAYKWVQDLSNKLIINASVKCT